MAVRVEIDDEQVVVTLSRWDRVMNWRRQVAFKLNIIESVSTAERSLLEDLIDHRALGWGTHDGQRRPSRRRVGTMLGRGTTGKQFWAVPKGTETDDLIVLHLANHQFSRAVLRVQDPQGFTSIVQQTLASAA